MHFDLKEELQNLSEPEYRRFNSRLIPNIDPDTFLGVRIPALRKIASRLVREDWRAYLKAASDETFEEIMLQGIVIGKADMDFSERLSWVEWFLPKIDNWAVCDSFCSGLKVKKEQQQEMWEFLEKCLNQERTYVIRFGVVMLLDHFKQEEWLWKALELLDHIRQEDYYVKMAVAWAVSAYYVCFPEQIMSYLLQNHLDDFTFNKALQKITESRKVEEEEKKRIRRMKRTPGRSARVNIV